MCCPDVPDILFLHGQYAVMTLVIVSLFPLISIHDHLPKPDGSYLHVFIFATMVFTAIIVVPPYCPLFANGSSLLYPTLSLMLSNQPWVLSQIVSRGLIDFQ